MEYPYKYQTIVGKCPDTCNVGVLITQYRRRHVYMHHI